MQAGAERALNRLMTALAGASVLFGQGMLETGLTFDIPTLLVDDEIIDYVLRMLAGFKVDATTLSTDLIKEVGPFGTYLAEMNTFEHLGDLSTYNLMNRRNYDMWAASGKPDLYGQARERAKEILATHKQKNPLSPNRSRPSVTSSWTRKANSASQTSGRARKRSALSTTTFIRASQSEKALTGRPAGLRVPAGVGKIPGAFSFPPLGENAPGHKTAFLRSYPLCGKNDALPPNLLPCTTGRIFHGKPRHTRQGAPCHDHDIKRTLRRDAESQDA